MKFESGNISGVILRFWEETRLVNKALIDKIAMFAEMKNTTNA